MNIAQNALSVLQAESGALQSLVNTFDPDAFEAAAKLVLQAKGYCIVTGMGKSGHIGKKLAATLASTGTPAFFLHPAEASHGDLGMIMPGSVLLALSNSGESAELKPVLTYCQSGKIPVIAITARDCSSLGKAANIILKLGDVPEACPNGLAPTTSTTMSLAIGDALAISVMNARGFSSADFGHRHPGGKLGRRQQTAAEWMAGNTTVCPVLGLDADARQVISTMTEARAGCVGITDHAGKLVGIITDGDLRRALEGDIFSKNAEGLMTPDPVTVDPHVTMGAVVELMKKREIGNIYIVNEARPEAVINLKDLVKTGYV